MYAFQSISVYLARWITIQLIPISRRKRRQTTGNDLEGLTMRDLSEPRSKCFETNPANSLNLKELWDFVLDFGAIVKKMWATKPPGYRHVHG